MCVWCTAYTCARTLEFWRLCRSTQRRVLSVTVGCRGFDVHAWASSNRIGQLLSVGGLTDRIIMQMHVCLCECKTDNIACAAYWVYMLSVHHSVHVWAWLIFPISEKHTPKLNCNLIKRTWCNLDQMLIRSHISSPIRDPSIVIQCALCQARYVLPAV